MSAPRVGSRPRHAGRSVGFGSLLMVPAIVVSFTVAELAGALFQSALGLSENESLTEAGALGVAAALLLALLLVVPQVVGIVLGSKARRLGARRLGTTGVVLNCLLVVFVLLTTTVNLLFL